MGQFLPKQYPQSVTPNYLSYVKWQLLVNTLSSACGGTRNTLFHCISAPMLLYDLPAVISMQSLLYAIGLGAATSIPAAAAINWIIKDGLVRIVISVILWSWDIQLPWKHDKWHQGQFGGMLFANVVSNRYFFCCRSNLCVSSRSLQKIFWAENFSSFDADPKRYRMLAGPESLLCVFSVFLLLRYVQHTAWTWPRLSRPRFLSFRTCSCRSPPWPILVGICRVISVISV